MTINLSATTIPDWSYRWSVRASLDDRAANLACHGCGVEFRDGVVVHEFYARRETYCDACVRDMEEEEA